METTHLAGIQACVFDAYGTLFDFNSAALAASDELTVKEHPPEGERISGTRCHQEQLEGGEAQAAAGIKPCFLSIFNQRGALRVTDMASKSTAESR